MTAAIAVSNLQLIAQGVSDAELADLAFALAVEVQTLEAREARNQHGGRYAIVIDRHEVRVSHVCDSCKQSPHGR